MFCPLMFFCNCPVHLKITITFIFVPFHQKGDGIRLRTTDIYDTETDNLTAYVDMPGSDMNHVLVYINETHIMKISGEEYSNDVFYFNTVEKTWTSGPMLMSSRRRTQAGLVTFKNKTQAVIVAGRYYHCT